MWMPPHGTEPQTTTHCQLDALFDARISHVEFDLKLVEAHHRSAMVVPRQRHLALLVIASYASCLAQQSTKRHSPPRLRRTSPRLCSSTGGFTSDDTTTPRLVAWYDAQLRRHPLRTKVASSGLASAVGDAVAQAVTGGAFDARRCASFALVGAAYFAPILHGWYEVLAARERRWRANGMGRWRSVLLQLLLNQSLGALTVNAGFFFALAVAEDALALDVSMRTLEGARRALGDQSLLVMRANWLVWPLPSLVNLAFVPLRYRVLFMNAVAVVWKTILSLITKGG